MKGIVFTLLLNMVDDTFGEEVTEEIISKSDLPSGGVYTSVGTYDHAEVVSLVTNLSQITNIPVSDLVQTFGKHLLGQFYELYPVFFKDIQSVTDFLEEVDSYIHVEVKKLYPEATLPNITTSRDSHGSLELIYKSDRMMGDLAEGLIIGAIEHFGNDHTVSRKDVNKDGSEQCVHFTIEKRHNQAA